MIDIDAQDNVFTGQDSAPWVHRVDTKGNAQQIAMPKGPDGVQIPTSGPAVVATPDGSAIFIASLMNEEGLIVQFRSGETTPRVITALRDTLDTRYWASPEQGAAHHPFCLLQPRRLELRAKHTLCAHVVPARAPGARADHRAPVHKRLVEAEFGRRLRPEAPHAARLHKGAHRICIAEGNSSSSPSAHMLRRAFVSNTLSNTITMAKSKNTEWNW